MVVAQDGEEVSHCQSDQRQCLITITTERDNTGEESRPSHNDEVIRCTIELTASLAGSFVKSDMQYGNTRSGKAA